MSITINKIDGKSDLHCHYDRQTNAQECYIELDCKNETLSASYNSGVGNSVPSSVCHGHDQRFGIPCLLSDAVNSLMDEILPLADRVVAGYESIWNGSNHVARFDDGATEALEEIQELCDDAIRDSDETNTLQEWDAGDWLDGVIYFCDENEKQCKWANLYTVNWSCDYSKITGETTDDELYELIEKIENDAESDNVVLNGLKRYIYELRDQCRENKNVDGLQITK